MKLRIVWLLLFIFFFITNIYADQNITISIFDCSKKTIDEEIKSNVKKVIYDFFNSKNYKVNNNEQIEEILNDFNIKKCKLTDSKAVKLGKILNTDFIIKYSIMITKKNIFINIKYINVKDFLIILDERLVLKKEFLDIKKILSILDDINLKIKSNEYVFNQKKEDLVKRTVMILPLYNTAEIEKYDYLSEVIRDALRTELLFSDIFLFTDFSIIDTEIKNQSIDMKNLADENYITKLALDLQSDVAVTGKYIVKDNNLIITLSAIDIFKNETVAVTKIKGSLGTDVFRLVDETVKDMKLKMSKNIKMVTKNYFDEMLKSKDNTVYDVNEKYRQRHFLNLSLGSGLYYWNDAVLPGYIYSIVNEGYGWVINGVIGYMYGFNKYFGFGPGLEIGLSTVIFNMATSLHKTGWNSFVAPPSFFCLFQFMWGDLRGKKTAFLLDIGGGNLFTINLGVMYKNFIFKAGYFMNEFGTGHNFTLNIGIMLNWSRKKKIKSTDIKL